MRRSFLLLAVVTWGLLGCERPTVPPAPKSPEATTSTTSTSSEPGKVAATESSTPAQEKKPEPAVINPNRIYQLSDLQIGTIKAGGKEIKVTVMDTTGKRQEGMMFLTAAEADPKQGMLFVFGSDQAAGRGFWMHNTLIPLDIIYISSKGKVIKVAHGKVKDDTNLASPAAYRNVLELVGGQAAKLGIKEGTPVEIPSLLTANAE